MAEELPQVAEDKLLLLLVPVLAPELVQLLPPVLPPPLLQVVRSLAACKPTEVLASFHMR